MLINPQVGRQRTRDGSVYYVIVFFPGGYFTKPFKHFKKSSDDIGEKKE